MDPTAAAGEDDRADGSDEQQERGDLEGDEELRQQLLADLLGRAEGGAERRAVGAERLQAGGEHGDRQLEEQREREHEGEPALTASDRRPGHIPTAANVPWSKAANDDGTFRSDDELKEIYSEAGVDWSKDTIAYCRIGERSSHTWFVLKELLGQENVKNYDGSWTEYGSLVGVPVALGDEAGEA